MILYVKFSTKYRKLIEKVEVIIVRKYPYLHKFIRITKPRSMDVYFHWRILRKKVRIMIRFKTYKFFHHF